MTDTVDRVQGDFVIAEPLADHAPEGNEHSVGEQDQPQIGAMNAEERDVDADVIGAI